MGTCRCLRGSWTLCSLANLEFHNATLGQVGPPDFVLEIEIQIARSRIHAFLCELSNYRLLHPLIESIEELSPSDEMPGARRYRVVDRIPLGPFRLRTSYVAALEPVGEFEVHGHAWQSPGIRLHTIYQLQTISSGTRLVERVLVTAPRILKRFVIRTARQSHEVTLAKMKALLEETGRSAVQEGVRGELGLSPAGEGAEAEVGDGALQDEVEG